MVKTEDPEGTKEERTTISTKAMEIMTRGAWDNPDCETTVAVSESDGETTVYRIFRDRHVDGDPLAAKDRWIRKVKKHCAIPGGELKATAVWNDADGGSVLVAITGQGIVAKEEAGLVI